MNAVFDHIEQAKYLLSALFEGGFMSSRSLESELSALEKAAEELGLSNGAVLLHQLGDALTGLRADQTGFDAAVLRYANLLTYYDMVADALLLESIHTVFP